MPGTTNSQVWPVHMSQLGMPFVTLPVTNEGAAMRRNYTIVCNDRIRINHNSCSDVLSAIACMHVPVVRGGVLRVPHLESSHCGDDVQWCRCPQCQQTKILCIHRFCVHTDSVYMQYEL